MMNTIAPQVSPAHRPHVTPCFVSAEIAKLALSELSSKLIVRSHRNVKLKRKGLYFRNNMKDIPPIRIHWIHPEGDLDGVKK